MPIKSLPPRQDEASCGCGSGLSAGRCCAISGDYIASNAQLDRARSIAATARRALAEGRSQDAQRLAQQVLDLAPRFADIRAMLGSIWHAEGRPDIAQALYTRALEDDPNQIDATQDLGLIAFRKGNLDQAATLARNAVRLAPLDPLSHNLLAMVLTELQQPQAGEYHYRRVLALLDAPSAIVFANLAWNLKAQGRIDEARSLYRQSFELNPTELQTLLGWAKMEEADRNFDEATRLLELAEEMAPHDATVLLFRAVTEGRKKNFAEAISILDGLADQSGALGPTELIEKGLLLDKLGRYREAFASCVEGKRRLREVSGNTYRDDEAAGMINRLEGFFTPDRMALLPRATIRRDLPQPIFIVGFPRSGTTMVEQMLTAHPEVAAGDELPMIGELTAQIPQILGSPLRYPEALADLWLGDKRDSLETLRDLYLQGARQRGVLQSGKPWFTDKMPLNETHLGLIALLFPASPIIHLVRHPLDVVLSVFSNLLTHGFLCSYELETAALHYVRVAALIARYRSALLLRYLPVRYEDIVDDQETHLVRLLEFIGLSFDERCINFHENRRYARTASYAQVTEKLYDRSRYRYRHYRDHLAPIIPILAPAITRLGYAIE